MRYALAPLLALLAGCASQPLASPGMLQPERRPPKVETPPHPQPVKVTDQMKVEALATGAAAILRLQQGSDNAEWPYEGVYRVRGQIPWGYRVGGTAICALALVEAPGYGDDQTRQLAVKKACKFICDSRTQTDLLVDTYKESYDVRSWGHLEAVAAFARMKQLNAIPAGLEQDIEDAMAFYLDALHKLEMPRGGWNYARPGAPSGFMTARALQALFEARAAGYKVDPEVVERALAFLEKTKAGTGAVAYSGTARPGEPRKSDGVPGATGRMCAVEATLALAGRGSTPNTRAACDAFIVHWAWLNQRRVQTGTHVPPYMVAPYYFMFAHFYAAQAAELLPASEKEEYRRHINELLFSVRAEDGSWNDRVFERSGAYGTAMAMLAIMAPDRRPPAKWPGDEVAAEQPGDKKPAPTQGQPDRATPP